MKTNSASARFEAAAAKLISSAPPTYQPTWTQAWPLDQALARLAQIGQEYNRTLLRLEISLTGQISGVYSAAQKLLDAKQISGTTCPPKPLLGRLARSSRGGRVQFDMWELQVFLSQHSTPRKVGPYSSANCKPKTGGASC